MTTNDWYENPETNKWWHHHFSVQKWQKLLQEFATIDEVPADEAHYFQSANKSS